MPPCGIVGRIVFSQCPFPDESKDVFQIWCQSVEPFDSFPRLLDLWPPNPPPCPLGYWGAICIYMPIPRWIRRREPTLVPIGLAVWQLPLTFWMFDPLKPPKCPLVSLGAICLAYIHFQMNLHMCTKFGANQISRLTSSPDFWIWIWITPLPNVEGRIVFSLCPFPYESADVYQIWCQSVQPFDSLSDSWICDP